MGDPAIAIFGDDIRYPTAARKFVRDIGSPSLADAFNSRGKMAQSISLKKYYPDREMDATVSGGAVFPDDRVLLMIGNTKELVDACTKAVEDTPSIYAIYSNSEQQLKLLYARITVSSWQDDTLIAVGPQNLMPARSSEEWHEFDWQITPTFLTILNGDTTEHYALPRIIRWIKNNDGTPWVKA